MRLGRTIGGAFTDHGNEVMDIGRSVAGKTIGLVQVILVYINEKSI